MLFPTDLLVFYWGARPFGQAPVFFTADTKVLASVPDFDY